MGKTETFDFVDVGVIDWKHRQFLRNGTGTGNDDAEPSVFACHDFDLNNLPPKTRGDRERYHITARLKGSEKRIHVQLNCTYSAKNSEFGKGN